MAGFTGPRAVFPWLGISYWQESYLEKNLPKNVDIDFVNSYKLYVQYSFATLAAVGVLLSIACWRWTFLRKWIYYFEIACFLLYSLLPLDAGNLR